MLRRIVAVRPPSRWVRDPLVAAVMTMVVTTAVVTVRGAMDRYFLALAETWPPWFIVTVSVVQRMALASCRIIGCRSCRQGRAAMGCSSATVLLLFIAAARRPLALCF